MRRSDAARVARWAHLAARAETDPASWVFTQLNVLEVDRIDVEVQERDGGSYLVIDTPAGRVTLIDEA